ncbi:EAL domain-containing protein [Rheinheimera baltica]|uniref:two-component system response regulator n=1 Tax=Rheinheimera baltica TaxID=67576 RepID=UPI00273FF429|nr:EAL domain-containing protein [Rheinheimera baltica]MDP5142086.1 EAL domain-containing protein [Rheinheimera baltica]
MELESDSKPSLLIVDDQLGNITLLSEILHDLAHIYFVTNGLEALDKAIELQPHVILLDIEMPEINGFEVCKLLKNHPLTAAISIIFISAHTEAEIEFNSLSFGAVDFIGRPFHREICRARVKNHLVLQQQAKELAQSKQALFVEKQRLLVTLNSIGDAVVATDIDGRVTFLNPIAEKMTGWRQIDALNKSISEVMQLRDIESKQVVTNPVYLALSERRIVAMALNCELVNRSSLEASAVEDSAAPIFDQHGIMLGAIIVFHDVGEARALATKMSFLANHDQLTGLPNRILLYDRIHLACRSAASTQRKVGIIAIDIDQFKYLNDSLGHLCGDELITLLVKRLLSILDPEQTLARIGGDEFVLVCPDMIHVEQIDLLAQRISRIMQQPFEIGQKNYNMALSMGISLFPADSANEEELMRHADVALFKAKQEGRNRFCFFSDELGQRIFQRHQQEQSLRDAIYNNRLEVYFQPKVDLQTEQVFAAESLVRLRDKNGTLISPGDFIPLAEETGLVVPLGKLVLIKACQQAARWLKHGFNLSVSVNIAAAQFADPDLAKLIEQTLMESRLPSALLELEVTETALIQRPEQTAEVLQRLRAIGLKIAIDDFGTGYSSLAYLKRFKVDVLKIDMSFVKDMLVDKSDYEIVKTIISLGRSMDIDLVAEGIETEQHKVSLLELGCPFGQGYYFGKPMPADDFMQFIVDKRDLK